MAKRTRFSEYRDRYANYRFELDDDGILLMQCHTNGGSLVWDWKAHDDMADAFADVAGDRDIKVLIHTGTGDNYNADWGRLPNGELPDPPLYDAMPGVRGLRKLDEKAWYARHMIQNVLDVDVPMISAVNGPCNWMTPISVNRSRSQPPDASSSPSFLQFGTIFENSICWNICCAAGRVWSIARYSASASTPSRSHISVCMNRRCRRRATSNANSCRSRSSRSDSPR